MKTGTVKKAFPFAFDGINIEHLAEGRPVSLPDNTFDGLAAAGYLEEGKTSEVPPEEALNRRIVEAIDKRLSGASDEDLKGIIARSGTPYSGNLVHARLIYLAKEQMIREMEGAAPVAGVDANAGVTEQPLSAPGSAVPPAAKAAIADAANGDAPTGTTADAGAGENKATNQFGDPLPGNQPAPGDAPVEPKNLDDMTVPELKEHAETNGVDLGDASKKADIIAAIEAASKSSS